MTILRLFLLVFRSSEGGTSGLYKISFKKKFEFEQEFTLI